MNALLQSELLKIRTVRGTWIVIGVAALLSSIMGLAMVRISVTDPPADGHPIRLSEIGLGPVQAMWFLAVGLAIVASAGEFQHRTIRATMLLAPKRGRVLLAKAIVSGGLGGSLVFAGAAGATLSAGITAVVSHAPMSMGGPAEWARIGAAAGLGVLWSVLATGLGILTRGTAIAITTLLLWRFVGEALLPAVLRQPGIARWTPSGAGNALVGLGGPDLLPEWQAGLLFAGYAIAVCGAAGVLFTRRDPS